MTPQTDALVQDRSLTAAGWAQLGNALSADGLASTEQRLASDVHWLMARVRQGDPSAAELCLELVLIMVEQLHALRKDKPTAFDDLVRWQIRWPGLLSRHPFYDDQSVPPANLGADFPVTIDKAAIRNPEHDVTQVALHLVFFLHRLRTALW